MASASTRLLSHYGEFGRWFAAVAILICMSGFAPDASGQPALPPPTIERPAERIAEDPLPKPIEEAEPFTLPPIPELSLGEIQGDAPDEVVVVETVELLGNTAIESDVLLDAIEPFLGRGLAVEGLEALRRRLTRVYVEAGYFNSGALIPAQNVSDGTLRVYIIEGRVSTIRLAGLKRYRESVLHARIESGLSEPINLHDIEDQIRLLGQDPRIEQIGARLRPGPSREEAILEVVVRERDPTHFRVRFDNDETPSVGAYAGRFAYGYSNLLGFGDRVVVGLTQTEGLTRLEASYDLPVHASGTRLFFDVSAGWAELVENSFRKLDIETSDLSLRLGIAQTLWRRPSDRIDVSVAVERRRSETKLLGQGFSFVEGPESGRSELSVVRAVGEWTHRGLASVLVVRSMFRFGLDVLNPTKQSGDAPDGMFFSWYGQLRGIYRLPDSNIELRLRGDIQLADRPLLPLEQFAIGGTESVRGYRRNQLVRDQGLSTALDIRVPVWQAADSRTILAVTPFVDFGYSWNRSRSTTGMRSLSSVGAGIEWRPAEPLIFGIEYAHGFRDTATSGDLQDESVYLRAEWRLF